MNEIGRWPQRRCCLRNGTQNAYRKFIFYALGTVFRMSSSLGSPAPTLNPSAPPAAWQPCGVKHVAVYGTLRAGGVNDIARLQPGIQPVGRTTLAGTLHDLGWYPGLSLNGIQPVLAEVYEIHDPLEQQLDRIEGIWPRDMGEYAKRLLHVDVELPDGDMQPMQVLVYEALPAVLQGMPVIPASDWLAWYAGQGRELGDEPFALRTENSAGPSAG